MTSTLVITGANGFVGTHLAHVAHAAGHRVIGMGREPQASPGLADNVDVYLPADLYETWPETGPVDAVVHLAGLAAVGPSFREPQRYIEINGGVMTRMCEGLLERSHFPRVVVVSSAAVYAPPAEARPVSESAPIGYNSPYSVAKLLVENQARYYATRGLDTLIARPFNHIGPGQGPGFLLPDLATAIRDLPTGAAITVGNLSTYRDYTDVRDVAAAYLTLALAPAHEHDVYNIATGTAHSGYDLLETLTTTLGRPMPPISVDPALLRPNDPPVIVGDSSRLRVEYGWAPTIDFRESIVDWLHMTSL